MVKMDWEVASPQRMQHLEFRADDGDDDRKDRHAGGQQPGQHRAQDYARRVELFGHAAAKPRRLIEHNWSNDVWTRGCYVGFMPPGVWSDYGSALRAPVGRIHWAGTETSDFWVGYMDGAVRSGERAAAEVLAELP